jgi:hypothetical protein
VPRRDRAYTGRACVGARDRGMPRFARRVRFDCRVATRASDLRAIPMPETNDELSRLDASCARSQATTSARTAPESGRPFEPDLGVRAGLVGSDTP